MSGSRSEEEDFISRIQAARRELAEIEETEIDDGEAARKVELQLDSLASALLDMITADKVEKGSPAPDDTDVYGWLIAQKLLPDGISTEIERILEVAASARYGEEPSDKDIEKAEEARQELLGVLSELLDHW